MWLSTSNLCGLEFTLSHQMAWSSKQVNLYCPISYNSTALPFLVQMETKSY